MDLQDYDYALDMWSLGCMFAGMVREVVWVGMRDVCVGAIGRIGR